MVLPKPGNTIFNFQHRTVAMSEIERLEQVLVENQFSRKNIREKVLLAIHAANEELLLVPFQKATNDLNSWLKTPASYPTKQNRINHIVKQINIEKRYTVGDIITEIMVIIYAVESNQTIQSVCGQLCNMFKFDDIFVGIKLSAEILAVVCESDLFDIIAASNSETGSLLVSPRYVLSADIRDYIAQTKYLPPLLCEPTKVKNNFGHCRLTFQESMILGAANHHDEYINLDNLNSVNSIALSLDLNIVQLEEQPKKPLNTTEKEKNFNLMRNASREVYADLIEQGNKFYNVHKYCKRGREYSQGYHVHIQGSSYKKALICLYKKEVIEL